MVQINSPARRAIAALVLGVVLFLVTGWAADQRNIVIDWSSFSQADALIFLGAYAQLVLAAAVFFQIRTADRALVRQVAADERRIRSERADALVGLIGTAANARSLYVHAIPALRNATYNHGDQDALDRAEAELVPAEQLRQVAHAARFRVEVMVAGEEQLIAAAGALTSALDTQRQRARSVLAWSRSPRDGRPTPDPQDAAIFPLDAEQALMRAAAALVAAPG
jgi:hypothetical protein